VVESITYHRGSYCNRGGKFNLKKKKTVTPPSHPPANSADAPLPPDPAPRTRPPPPVKAKEDEDEENDVIPLMNLLVVLRR